MVGCSTSEHTPPPPIPDTVMVNLLTELLILEPAFKEMHFSLQDSIAKVYYERTLQEKGHNLQEFIQSMKWLQEDPKRMEKTYSRVLENLEKMDSQ
ncbi:MAG: DUF4296 domain-containing protein [Saprospiraceae bacterium]